MLVCVSTAVIGSYIVLLIAMKAAYFALVFFTCLKFDKAMLIMKKYMQIVLHCISVFDRDVARKF